MRLVAALVLLPFLAITFTLALFLTSLRSTVLDPLTWQTALRRYQVVELAVGMYTDALNEQTAAEAPATVALSSTELQGVLLEAFDVAWIYEQFDHVSTQILSAIQEPVGSPPPPILITLRERKATLATAVQRRVSAKIAALPDCTSAQLRELERDDGESASGVPVCKPTGTTEEQLLAQLTGNENSISQFVALIPDELDLTAPSLNNPEQGVGGGRTFADGIDDARHANVLARAVILTLWAITGVLLALVLLLRHRPTEALLRWFSTAALLAGATAVAATFILERIVRDASLRLSLPTELPAQFAHVVPAFLRDFTATVVAPAQVAGFLAASLGLIGAGGAVALSVRHRRRVVHYRQHGSGA